MTPTRSRPEPTTLPPSAVPHERQKSRRAWRIAQKRRHKRRSGA